MVEESISVAYQVGEPWLVAYALLHRLLRVAYGPAIEHDDERAGARAAGIQALHGFEAVGDGMSSAQIQLCLGELAMYDGDYERATTAFRAALPMMRAVGWTTSVADGLVRLGDAARTQGDDLAATSRYREALALYRQSGRRLGANLMPHLPAVLCHLADMAVEQGALDLAQTYVSESLKIIWDTQPTGSPQQPEALEVQAAVFAGQGVASLAIRCASAASALRETFNYPLGVSEQARLQRRLEAAYHALSTDEQSRAWAEGRGMTLDELGAGVPIGPPIGSW